MNNNMFYLNKLYFVINKYLSSKIKDDIIKELEKNVIIEDFFNQKSDEIEKALSKISNEFYISLDYVIESYWKLISEDSDFNEINESSSKYFDFKYLINKNEPLILGFLLTLYFLKVEKLFEVNDESDCFNLLLMKINEILCKMFKLNKIYTLIDNVGVVDVIGWYNPQKYDLDENYKLISFYNNLKEKSVSSDKNSIYKSRIINITNDIDIIFLYDGIINNPLADFAFDCIHSFIYKNIDKININHNINSDIVYNDNLILNIEKFVLNNEFVFEPYYSKTNVNILHLSDMHIQSGRLDEYSNIFLKKYYEQKIGKIDFIVITGDAIEAGKSSKEIVNNYVKALKTIEKIAKSILGNIWRKRLLIIPGNHDYGMINELKLELQDRSYKNAFTNNDSASEKEKFIFFHLLFDGILLKNNYYVDEDANYRLKSYKFKNKSGDDCKIIFNIFNTSCYANTIRSNKVYLDVNKMDLKLDYCNIFLMHHTPFFKIDYYRDIFLKIIYSDNEQNKNLEEFIFGLKEIEKEWSLNYEENKDEINNTIEIYNNKLQELFESSKDKEYKKNIQHILEKNNNIIKYLNDDLIDDSQIEERNKLYMYFLNSINDSKEYNDSINVIKGKTAGTITILGGHQHQNMCDTKNGIKICEIGKTIDKQDSQITVRFGVLQQNIYNYEENKYTPYECKDNKL